MGFVDLPATPTQAGQMGAIRIQLDKQELQVVVDRVKGALAVLQTQPGPRPHDSSAAPAPRANHPGAAKTVSPPATLLASQAAAATTAFESRTQPTSTSAPPHTQPAASTAASLPPKQLQSAPQQASVTRAGPPPAAAFHPARLAAPAVPLQQPPPAPQARPASPPPSYQYSAAPPPAPAPAPVPARPIFDPAAVPAMPRRTQGPVQAGNAWGAAAGALGAGAWRLASSSDPEDHGGEVVAAAVFSGSFPGLVPSFGDAGWLISTSSQTLNLWECSPRADDGLMLMHSQMMDYRSTALALEGGNPVLVAGSLDVRSGGACLSLHSTSAQELGFLAPLGSLPLPPPASPLPPPASPPRLIPVVSLHGFGGPLAHCCAAAHGTDIAVYPAAASSAPKALWRAHSSPATALHASIFGIQLFSGAADGRIHMWDMKVKPTVPQLQVVHHRGQVAGLALVNQHCLASASHDGRVVITDLRRPETPQATTVPDGKPVVALAASPVGDCVAAATPGGVYAVDLLDAGAAVSPITQQLRSPAAALTWNSNTGDLYACTQGGSICVLRQNLR